MHANFAMKELLKTW